MGILTIAFDDGYKDTFDSCARYLADKGLRATFAVPSGFIGSSLEGRPVINADQMTELKNMGHEVAAHSTMHKNLLDLSLKEGPEAVIQELTRSKKQLESVAVLNVRSFVFPFIEANNTPYLRRLAADLYASSRITTEKFAFNPLPVKDAYSVTGVAITTDFSLEDYNQLVDIANYHNLWLIEVFHLVSSSNTRSASRNAPYRFYMNPDNFSKHIDHIISRGIPVMTQSEVIEKCLAR